MFGHVLPTTRNVSRLSLHIALCKLSPDFYFSCCILVQNYFLPGKVHSGCVCCWSVWIFQLVQPAFIQGVSEIWMRIIHVVNESCSRHDLMIHKVYIGIVTVFVTVEFAWDIWVNNCAEAANFMESVMLWKKCFVLNVKHLQLLGTLCYL